MGEGDGQQKPSWWQTLPGVLTAFAAVITAVTGLIVGVYQSGLLKPSPATTIAASPAAAPAATIAGQNQANNANQASLPPAVQAAQVAVPAASNQAASPPAAAPAQNGAQIDLLSPGNGGHLVAASGDNWKFTIDGEEDYHCCFYPKQSAVYAFKDGRQASFAMFSSFIDATRPDNVHEFELAAGNESALGEFKVIAKCETQNIKLFETPYQECKFPAVRAKYFRVTILSTYGSTGGSAYLQEFRLLGNLN